MDGGRIIWIGQMVVGTKQTDVGLHWQSGEKVQNSSEAERAPPTTPACPVGIWAPHLAACMRKRVREFPQVSHTDATSVVVRTNSTGQSTTCRCSKT